ncbi:MAG: hypothetical protein M3R24_24740 [Chloroflexota bacterium]|nr:hypothetical protein [Chloroflexota bacterium]
MLRNVLADYLDSVKERAFDLPFISLLPSMGFYDIHFTHGQVEFGKDFIAKRVDDGVEVQYSFQSKVGDISQTNWRNDIMGQILEASISEISHPQFDTSLPHQVVLVTTGRLKGNAALGLQELNTKLVNKFGKRAVVTWERENLIEFFETYGLTGIHQATATGFTGYAQFYLLYGRSLQANISDRHIEEFSRLWLDETMDWRKRILRSTIEAEVIATKCLENGLLYEAIHTYLAAIRVILHTMYDVGNTGYLDEVYQQADYKLRALCKLFFSQFQQQWRAASNNILQIAGASPTMVSYLVWCARVMEIVGLLYFLDKDERDKADNISFLQEFIDKEPGCGHVPSDRYAVSLVVATLALCHSQKLTEACALLHRSVVWLCDHYEDGLGLAPLEADEYTETATLLGSPFEFISIHRAGNSFVATAICDLAAFIGNKDFYGDVVNDIMACKIVPTYWQVADTKGLFQIESDDVITYPNIRYENNLTPFEIFEFAEHISHEPSSFRIVQKEGPLSLIFLAMFLRDRYFPTIWPLLSSESAR